MTAVFLAPHNDDETLFGAFTLIEHNPLVIVCLRSHLQWLRGTGIHCDQREAETSAAMAELGVTKWRQWPVQDSLSIEALDVVLRERMRELRDAIDDRALVFAPAVEDGGHEQHNLVGKLAPAVFGEYRIVPYLTYRRGHGRSTSDRRVAVSPNEIKMKLRALACYESQIAEPSTRDWFLGEQWEYGP